jgi:hypothetical protein
LDGVSELSAVDAAMADGRAAGDAHSLAGRWSDRPARISARTMDRRTLAWRRRCEYVQAYTQALGSPTDDVILARIEAAAELRTTAELSRAQYLAGGDVSLEDLVRIENLAARAERSLGLGSAASAGSPSAPSPFGRLLDEMTVRGARAAPETPGCAGVNGPLAQPAGAAPHDASHSAEDVGSAPALSDDGDADV